MHVLFFVSFCNSIFYLELNVKTKVYLLFKVWLKWKIKLNWEGYVFLGK